MRQHIIALVERHLGHGKHTGESNISLRCPFHKSGEERKPSFSVNVDLGLFQCFTCKISGNIIKLLRLLGLPRHVIDMEVKDIRSEIEANRKLKQEERRRELLVSDPFLADVILPEALIKPYEWCPSKLVESGFDPQWLHYMDIGYDRVHNRITWPIRDLYGNLAGIAGGAAIAGQDPKYKVYQGRRKNPETGLWIPSEYGEWFDEKFPNYNFSNHDFLWNYDAVYPRLFFGKDPGAFIIVVEGYKACLWLLQNGYWNTVALMGSSMSDRQASLLHRLNVDIVMFLDNDEPGRKATRKVGRMLWLTRPGVFIARYPDDAHDKQPDHLVPDELASAISGALTYPQYTQQGGRT